MRSCVGLTIWGPGTFRDYRSLHDFMPAPVSMFFSLSFSTRFCPPFQSSYPSFWYCLSFFHLLMPYNCSHVPLLHAFCLVLQIKCCNLTVLFFTFRNGLWFFYWIFCIKLCSSICKPEKKEGEKRWKKYLTAWKEPAWNKGVFLLAGCTAQSHVEPLESCFSWH